MADDDFSLPDWFTPRLFQVESGGDPTAITGSNRGLGQFSPNLERKYGITDWRNPDQQASAVQKEMAEYAPQLSKTLERNPTPGELYVAHQQGLAGAQAHFRSPDGVAWQNVRQFYPSDKVARSAIWGNIPDSATDSPQFHKGMFPGGVDDVTSNAFVNGWIAKFEGSGGPSLLRAAGSVPAGATASYVPSTGGLLAGTDIVEPQQPDKNDNFTSTISRISGLFNQPAPKVPPARFRPIQMAVPAGINAQLVAAALRNRGSA